MSDIKINFDGKQYDLGDFDLGDLEELEEYIGGPLDGEAMNSMKAAVGFVWLIKRREDPAFTIEQARKVKLSVLETANEDTPEAKRPPKRAAR